MLQITLYTVFL